MKRDQYQPIACSSYDVYEIAILRGQELNLDWEDAAGSRHRQRVKPVALITRQGEEFLRFVVQGELKEIRLDKIGVVD